MPYKQRQRSAVLTIAWACLTAFLSLPPIRAQSAPPLQIIAELNPDNPLEVRFTFRNAEPNGVHIRSWRFGDGTRSYDASPTHRYALPSTYRVLIRYDNSSGSLRERARKLNLDSPPTVTIASFGQVAGGPATELWFQAAGKSSSTSIDAKNCLWTFGDGSTGLGDRVEHAYAGAGAFEVKTTLEDSVGNIVCDDLEVTVREVIVPPLPVPTPVPPTPVPVPTPTPVPTPVPTPTPAPSILTIVCDFETAPSGLDGVVLKLSSDAHGGTSSLAMDLRLGATLQTGLSNLFLPKLIAFAFKSGVEATWASKWDGTASLDVTKLKPALAAYLGAHAAEFTEAQTLKIWRFAEQIVFAGPVLPIFEAGRWYCLGVSYVFPTATVPGRLELKQAGVTFLKLENVSILDDDKLLGAILQTLLSGKVVSTTAITSWLDDLKISTAPLACP